MTLEWVTVVLGTPQLHLDGLVEGVVVVGVTAQPDAIFYLFLLFISMYLKQKM